MKKKTNKKIKCCLCIFASFFLISLMYLDSKTGKDGVSLITYKENTIITNVNEKELLKVFNKGTGVVILINDKKTTSRIVNLLYNLVTNEKVYLYNLKNDEIILEEKNNEIIIKQHPSELYNKLLDLLGPYKETYILESIDDGTQIFTEYKKIYTPMVLFIKEGKILLSHYISDDEINDEDLLAIYKQGTMLLNNGYNL